MTNQRLEIYLIMIASTHMEIYILVVIWLAVYEPKLMFSYVFRPYMLIEFEFEFLLEYYKHKKSARS